MTGSAASAGAGRVRRVGALLESPADIWLLLRVAAWAAVLPGLKRLLGLEALARLAWTDPDGRTRGDTAKIFALCGLLAGRAGTVHGACYERSLLAYRFLAQSGADPRLVVALTSDGRDVTGHAWVSVGGEPVGETIDLAEFTPVAVFGRGGQIVEDATASP